jgi:glycosyltransferase involved in cell wall biosynthesis
MKVLFLVTDMDYRGAARELMLLVRGLAEVEPCVAVLGRESPWSRQLQAQGIRVEVLGRSRLLDIQPWLRLRDVYRSFGPHVVHAWEMPAVRSAAALGAARKTIASRVVVRQQRWFHFSALDRVLLRRVAQVVVNWPTDVRCCEKAGIASRSIAVIPPAVDLEASQSDTGVPLALPPGARVILCIGPLERENGIRDAIWAFDILKYLYDDLHLVIAGDGPERPALASFAKAIGVENRVLFLGHVASLGGLFKACRLLCVPSPAGRGTMAVLEAMAAGRPVVVAQVGGLAALVEDGVTSYLVPPGDKAALARKMRLILEDAELSGHLGSAGRKRAAQFSIAAAAQKYLQLYKQFSTFIGGRAGAQ